MGGAGYCSMFKLVGRTIGPAQPAFWRPESSPVAGCRFRETHVRILPSYMEAECTVSGTANCAGLSVPNFMLRQEESSSCSCMLLLSPLDSSTQSSARILPSYMEAECTVSGTANCAGLSVPNFMLRQEESSSCSCMLLLNTLQTPFPLRLRHPVLRPDLAILYGS